MSLSLCLCVRKQPGHLLEQESQWPARDCPSNKQQRGVTQTHHTHEWLAGWATAGGSCNHSSNECV